MKGTESAGKKDSYLTFLMGGEHYAISVAKVTELLEMVPVTRIPRIPEFMRGVINLRGEVVPVVDGRRKFSLPPVEDTIDTCIVVMSVSKDDKEVKVGVVVDHVTEVIEVAKTDILPLPSVGNQYKTTSFCGVIKINEQITMVVDVDREFETDVIELDEEVLEEGISS